MQAKLQASNHIHENEKLTGFLIENVKDYAIFLTDISGFIMSWNTGAAHITGYKADEITGKHISIFYTAEDIANGEPEYNINKTKENGRFEKEGWRQRKDGTKFWADIILNTVKDENDNITGFFNITRDLTEKKMQEEIFLNFNHQIEIRVKERTQEVYENEKKYRHLFDNNPMPIWVMDLETFQFLDVNEAAVLHYGYSRENFLSMTTLDIRPDDEKERFKRDDHSANINPADGNRGRWKHIKNDGTIIHVEITAYNIFFEGRKARLVMSKDITEKLEGEERLLASESRFRSIIEQFPYPVINYAPDGRCIGANESWETMWQDKRENVKGYNILHDRQMMDSVLARYVDKAFKGEISVSEPYLYDPAQTGQKGRKRWMVMTFFPLKNSHNELLEVILILQDITERKSDEEKIVALNKELLKSEKKFRGLIENSYDIVSMIDENLQTFYRSPSSERITGWSDTERKMADSGITETHPEDIEKLQKTRSDVLLNPAIPFPVLFRTKHKKGNYIWIEGMMTNMLHEESIKAIVCNFRDVTERKEAEERIAKSEKIYKAIASGIPGSVICLFDHDFRYFLIEGDMLEKLGYSKERLLGEKVKDALTPDRYREFLPNLQRVFKGELFTVESSRFDYHFLTRYVPLKDDNNLVYAAMTVAIDITYLKNAEHHIAELNLGLEQKITERTKQLEIANKELESFSYSVSHDLRAPLRAVSGYSMMLKEDYELKLDFEANRIINAIISNAAKMGNLIDDLLDFSRMARKDISFYKIDMTSLAESCVAEFLHDDANSKYSIKIDALPEASGDFAMLRQVWMNLINNAIKYSSKQNCPQIGIGYKPDTEMNIYFVRDNGAGFDMQYADKLFGVFQRLHSQDEFEGTGVGLALVNRIINKHGGNVWGEGLVNSGATFYFSLPKQN